MADDRAGADAFLEQLVAAGVRWIFGNPGTNEQPFLGRLGNYPELGYVLALHEAVAVGAAEGFARASGDVGVVQLHAGPGLGNGVGMLHNARAGQTALVVYVGQAQQRSLHLEPTLGANLVAEAGPVSKWAYEVRTADEIPPIVRRAFKVAQTPPRGPVVLSIPMDVLERATSAPVLAPSYVSTRVAPDPVAVGEAASLIATATAPAVLVGDGVAVSGAIAEVGLLARTIGAPIYGAFTSEVCVDPDEGLNAGRLPSIDGARAAAILADYDVVIAIGTKIFSHVFPVPGLPLGDRPFVHIGLDPWELGKNQPGTLVLGDERVAVRAIVDCILEQVSDGAAAAERRARIEVSIARSRSTAIEEDRARWDSVPMTVERAVAEIASALEPEVRIVDESLTGYGAVARYFRPRPGSWFRLRGGGIGAGMPLPIGVQLADPDRRVVALVGDGAAVYTVSALWTAAHHRLPIVWAILNNRGYRTLRENARVGPSSKGITSVAVSELVDPQLDFVAIARGMGADGERLVRPTDIGDAVRTALASNRPSLIDIALGDDLASP